MMNRQVKTRTQRRVEKRQALTVLGLALVALLASFVFGVMVGRRGDSAEDEVTVVRVEPAPVPAPVVTPAPTAAPVEPASAPEPVESAQDPLTFYDRLPNGEAPLGSGVNLPPAPDTPSVRQPAMPVETEPQVTPPAPAPAPMPEPPPTMAAPAPAPAPASTAPAASLVAQPGGGYGVQVGAFQSAADAGKLVSQLQQKGYPAMVVEADLGAKGRWYRVRVGPFDKAGAEKAATRLQQDQYKGFVTRM